MCAGLGCGFSISRQWFSLAQLLPADKLDWFTTNLSSASHFHLCCQACWFNFSGFQYHHLVKSYPGNSSPSSQLTSFSPVLSIVSTGDTTGLFWVMSKRYLCRRKPGLCFILKTCKERMRTSWIFYLIPFHNTRRCRLLKHGNRTFSPWLTAGQAYFASNHKAKRYVSGGLKFWDDILCKIQ